MTFEYRRLLQKAHYRGEKRLLAAYAAALGNAEPTA